MRLIFHIGMGKTGTSAIQAALDASGAELAAHGARYLGMWNGFIDPAYRGYEGFERFAAQPADAIRADARRAVDILGREADASTFVLSNEAIFGNVHPYTPFLETLIECGAAVELVLYARPMADWLPSAFIQWNALHKVHRGPVRSFAEAGRGLAQLYGVISIWTERFGERVRLRRFDKGQDIVADFSEVIGIPRRQPDRRVWERIEDAEALLRATFNDRIEAPALPTVFDGVVRLDARAPVRRLDVLAARALDMEGLDALVAEHAPLLEAVRDAHGVDLLTAGPPPAEPDLDALRARVLDYLIEMSFTQAQRIAALEREVAALKAARAEGTAP